MNEDDQVRLYDGMLSILRDRKLEQIADYVEAIVDEGQIRKKRVKINESEIKAAQEVFKPKRSSSSRIVYQKEDFSPRDQLILLLDVIEATLIDVIDIRRRTVEIFTEQADRQNFRMSPEIHISADVASQRPTITLEPTEIQEQVNAIQPLREAISRIREEL